MLARRETIHFFLFVVKERAFRIDYCAFQLCLLLELEERR